MAPTSETRTVDEDDGLAAVFDEEPSSDNDDQNEKEEQERQLLLNTRNYQLELFEMAKVKNVIICLPTGSGKTWIAMLLAKHYYPGCVQHKKKIIFLANTVQLVEQQCDYFKRYFDTDRVDHFIGAMGVDNWRAEGKWPGKLDAKDIFVMSTQIFLDILNKELHYRDVCLLILDECHHAKKQHPMKRVMDIHNQCSRSGVSPLPRVLGLTACVAPSSKKGQDGFYVQMRDLESTLKARAVTSIRCKEVKQYSTNATIRVETYSGMLWDDTYNLLGSKIEQFEAFSIMAEDHPSVRAILREYNVRDSQRYTKDRDMIRTLVRNIQEIQSLYSTLGPVSAEHGVKLLRMELKDLRKKVAIMNSREVARLILDVYDTWLLTMELSLTKIRRSGCPEHSPKLILLANELYKKKDCKDLCAIVFIQKRLDCQVVQLIMNKFAENYPNEWGFLRSNYVIGARNDPTLDENEAKVSQALQKRTIQEFRDKKYNVVFSTSVLEEGLDVPSCNLIIRFDQIQIYQSFVQSMGRARHKDAHFVILCSEAEKASQLAIVNEYQAFRDSVANALILNADCLEVDINPDITPDELPPLCPGGTPESPRLTSYDAISTVYIYCSLLSAYSVEMMGANRPVDWYEEIPDPGGRLPSRYIAYLVLPKQSGIKGKITGHVMPTKEGAKRAVHLETCKRLYSEGALDNNLRPFRITLDEKVLHQFIRPAHPGSGLPKKWLKTAIPHHLNLATTEGETYFVYELQIHRIDAEGNPVEPSADRPKEKLFDYKDKLYSTGILSAVSLDMIPPFKLECSRGTLAVKLHNLTENELMPPIRLTSGQREQLKAYQRNIFVNMLGMKLKHLKQVVDSAIWVVPIRKFGYFNYCIDYKLMQEFGAEYASGSLDAKYDARIPENERVFPEDDTEFRAKRGYADAVVIPWCFRDDDPNHKKEKRMFCVLGVSNLTEESPSLSHLQQQKGDGMKTFKDEAWEKYNVRVTRTGQNLLECAKIGETLDYLKENDDGTGQPKREKKKHNDVLHYIPELMRVFSLPASLFTQAKMLPAILHRINRFLHAMELGLQISGEVGGELRLPTYRLNDRWAYNEIVGEPNKLKNDVKTEDIVKFSYPKRPETDSFTEHSHQSIQRGYKRQRMDSGNNLGDWTVASLRKLSLADRERSEMDTIFFPPVYELLEAITTKGAHDRMNLERLEVIGDSFLKYTATMSIFPMFSGCNEGQLSQIRSKVVCNENLKWLGESKGLAGILAGGMFEPKDNFLPPSFLANEKVAMVAMKSGRAHDILEGLDVTYVENATEEDLIEYAKSEDIVVNNSSKSMFPGFSELKEKDVADCVEAVIGAYYLTGGESSALHVMDWFGIRYPDKEGNVMAIGPPDLAAFTAARGTTNQAPNDITNLVPLLATIEEILGHKFKDPLLLLEALTHPSDHQNQLTGSFERLEFLGDAVLDFLITRHVYNKFLAKGPGEITDLRSALVNNVTFATLAVRYGFQKMILNSSNAFDSLVQKFVDFQDTNEHQATGHIKILNDCGTEKAENIDVPKALGDVFESICGAVFMDTGLDLEETWKCFYPLMSTEIEMFSKCCPKAPIREIGERGYKAEVKVREDGVTECTVTIPSGPFAGQGPFIGVGKSKKSAKDAAAKFTMRKLPSRQ